MQSHSVRALAFHHEKGYEAQRELALKFAGKDGRVATVEDILYAQMHSGPEDFVSTRVFITGSYVYCGRKDNKGYLVFAHGNGPEPKKSGQLRSNSPSMYDHIREKENRPNHPEISWGIEQEEFEDLMAGKHGPVGVVDLSTYRNKAKRTDKKAGNRYTFAEAQKDEIIRAAIGKFADEYFAYLHNRQVEWLKNEPRSARVMLPMIINFLRIGSEWSAEKIYAPIGHAVACPLTVDPPGFYVEKWDSFWSRGKKRHRDKHQCSAMSIETKTNSGIDDLGGSAYYIVGIRGKEPITEVVPEFRTVAAKVKELWPKFVQPIAEVPHDPYVGIKPDGSRERPYCILNRWHTQPIATGRIMKDGAASTVPEYCIKKAVRVPAPRSVTFKQGPYNFYEGFPYTGMWEALKAAMPQGANAIAFGSSCSSGGKIAADVAYWHIEVDEEPFRLLMKCGEDFFSQYNDEKKISFQPHLLVEEATELDKKLGWRIPDQVLNDMWGREQWPLYSHLIANAPVEANAMWIEKESVGYQEKIGKNVMHVSVHYYKARFADKAFRPFTELRGDFDWILERRAKANLLAA